MKTKKLVLNKQTIAHLDRKSMQDINAGIDTWGVAASVLGGLVGCAVYSAFQCTRGEGCDIPTIGDDNCPSFLQTLGRG